MKSFAAGVRDAIVRADALGADRDCCRLAVLSGFALSAGSVSLLGGSAFRLTMRSEHAGIVRSFVNRLKTLAIESSVRIEDASRLGGRRMYALTVEKDDARSLADMLAIDLLNRKIPKFKKRCCRNAFLRGVFLGSGTISDPARAFRLEFVLEDRWIADALARFLAGNHGISAGVAERRGKWIVYTNDAESIIGILSRVGAHGAIFDMENTRILRDARNHANRAANCDTANIAKMLSAAQRQQEAVQKIERTIGVGSLPELLRETAVLRLKNPDLSLEELGERLSASKSGAYHRLRRLEAIARSIDEE
ncbi:MAG: DNA-binding protein WhiA [Clostridia bacterium]|nr:DNA-binding protein WhiA [Clostridia bacterium]